jgi:hypothetical protein
MKEIIITTLSISVCFIVYIERLKIKHYKTLKKQSSINILLLKDNVKYRSLIHDLTTLPTKEVINENELIIKHFGR